MNKIVNFNLNPYKNFINKLLYSSTNNKNKVVEYEFTLMKKNCDLIVEFYKGKDIISRNMNDSIFGEVSNFACVHCHTHPLTPGFVHKYSPPSAKDFIAYITKYFKYSNRFFFVFAPEGVYIVSLGEKLLNIINSNEAYVKIAYDNLPNSAKYDCYESNYPWDIFEEDLEDRLNIAHIILQNLDNLSDPIIKKTIRYAKKRKYQIPDSFSDYLRLVRNVGFNIDFFNWYENWNFLLEIDRASVHLTNLIMKNRFYNIFDNMLNDSDKIPSKRKICNLHKNGYFKLNSINLKILYKKLIKAPEGKMIIIS